MEKSLMNDIFYYLCLQDYRKSGMCKKYSEEAYLVYDILLKKLDKEQSALFEKFIDLRISEQAEESFRCFKEGFQMALRLAIECFFKDTTP